MSFGGAVRVPFYEQPKTIWRNMTTVHKSKNDFEKKHNHNRGGDKDTNTIKFGGKTSAKHPYPQRMIGIFVLSWTAGLLSFVCILCPIPLTVSHRTKAIFWENECYEYKTTGYKLQYRKIHTLRMYHRQGRPILCFCFSFIACVSMYCSRYI